MGQHSVAVLLLDQTAQLRWANTAGQDLLRTRDGLANHAMRVVAVDRTADGQLQSLVRAVCSCSDAMRFDVGGELSVKRCSGKAPFAVSVSPVTAARSGANWNDEEGPRALVVVSDPDAEVTVSEETLIQAYDLTRAEARLAAMFARTASLKECAGELGITQGTARQYMKRIFLKSGSRSQPELMKHLLGFAAEA